MSNRLLFLAKAHVQAYTRVVAGAEQRVQAHETKRPPAIVSFRSGGSAPADFRGYVVANRPVGVTLSEMGPGSATWDMVIGYARRGGQVFVDTGAFTAFTKGQPVNWQRVTQLQRQLAAEAGPGTRLHFVAPDIVGDQHASLGLLEEYRHHLRDLIAAGHDILVPVQKGELAPYQAWREAARILGTDDFRPAVPSNKVAFSREELADLFDGPVKPSRVHFLGIAGDKRRLAELAATVHTRAPHCQITTDANRLRAMTGQGRPVTESAPRWLLLFKEMGQLLEDPKLRAEWEAKYATLMKDAARTAAIFGAENNESDRKQHDLFG